MQEILVDIIDDCNHFKVLIVNIFNLEYFDLTGEVIIHDNTLFELRIIISTRTICDFKWCGDIFSWHSGSQFSEWWFDINVQNVPIQVYDIPNNMSYNYTYTLVCLYWWCWCGYNTQKSTKLWWTDPFLMRGIRTTSHCIYNTYKKMWGRKKYLSGVANFHIDILCAIDVLKV